MPEGRLERTRMNYIGYAPPMNAFEKWREQTWPKWATALWPIRRGAIVPITYDEHASANKIYFLANDRLHVWDKASMRRAGNDLK